MENLARPRKIKLLPPELRDQIAAGEVVERPASVLKELLENSIDAGADEIIVNIEDGGQTFLSVRDNGYGVEASELDLAVTSHATSKIHSLAELLRVSSYGFRGEALPSIASVSRLKMSSRAERDGLEHDAAFIEVDYGRAVSKGPAVLPYGTFVEVRDLFFNVPARLKFLKTNATELKRCQEVFVRTALAHANISLILNSGKRELNRFMKGESLRARLGQVWPSQIVLPLEQFFLERGGMKVHGLAGQPGAAQPKADRMFFYVNGRPVHDRILQRAAREAYRGRLLAREFPQVILFLELDPEEVDVNAHPAKSEVRFRDERSVFGLVMRAIESSLFGREVEAPGFEPERAGVAEQSALPLPALHAPGAASAEGGSDLEHAPRPKGFWGEADRETVGIARNRAASRRVLEFFEETSASGVRLAGLAESAMLFGAKEDRPAPASTAGKTVDAGDFVSTALPDGLKYLGQVASTYLVVSWNDRLFLLDQHAVHERILFSRFKRDSELGQSQLLAIPLELVLHPTEAEQLRQIWGELAALGFSLNYSVQSGLLVKGIPSVFGSGEARDFLRAALAEKSPGLDRLLEMLACKASIKAGQNLSQDEAMLLLWQWLDTPEKEFCPHGRPAVLSFGTEELEKMFKRRV